MTWWQIAIGIGGLMYLGHVIDRLMTRIDRLESEVQRLRSRPGMGDDIPDYDW